MSNHLNILLSIGGLGNTEIFLVIIIVALWAWAINDLLKSKFNSDLIKLIWGLAIIFMPVIGSVFYLAFGKQTEKI